MKNVLREITCLICVITILAVSNVFIYADIGTIDRVLQVKGDGVLPKEHQALTMTVGSVSSTSSLQAFCIGWTFTFSNANGSVMVYVPLSSADKGSGTETYTFPLTTGWTLKSTGIAGAKSIRDLVKNKKAYDSIIKDGCHVHADARIEKYSCTNGTFKPLYIYADSKAEIDSNFSEFSYSFKNNTKSDYFDLNLTFAPEPPDPAAIPDPKVTLLQPKNNTTVLKGTTVTFNGTGTGCHHIGGFVDGKFYGVEQYNPNEDITSEITYETTVRLDEARDYTFQTKGRNTGQENDEGSVLAESAVHTVHVIAPPPDSGSIYIRCIDYDTEKEIKDTSQTIPGVTYGQARTVGTKDLDQSILGSYEFKDSCQTFSEAIPDKSKFAANTSQTVTLSSTNKTAYIYFRFKKKEADKPPVTAAKPPTAILNNTSVAYAGDDVSFDGSQSYDTDGNITDYSWSLPGAYENTAGNSPGGKTWYEREGTYSIGLSVTDDSGLSASASGYVKILPPKPNLILKVSAEKMKENRKITLDLSESTSPARYPIDWSLTTWNIEAVQGSGGTGDYGVRLEDGKVYKNSEGKAQRYESGKWTETSLDFNSILTGQKTIQFQARDSGRYKITAVLTNTASFDGSRHYSNSTEKTINIVEDLAPAADFSGPDNNAREHESPTGSMAQKFGIIPVTCTTVSPDGDPIGIRKWSLRYDSNNDGSFADEKTIYPYAGNEPFTSGVQLVVNGDSDSVCEIWSYEVGSYTEALEAFEEIPEEETVVELLIREDYKSKYVQGW